MLRETLLAVIINFLNCNKANERFFNCRKARRKEKDSSGASGGLSGANDEGKLYLESALLERHLNETELQRLVSMPPGLDENEWMASHSE